MREAAALLLGEAGLACWHAVFSTAGSAGRSHVPMGPSRSRSSKLASSDALTRTCAGASSRLVDPSSSGASGDRGTAEEAAAEGADDEAAEAAAAIDADWAAALVDVDAFAAARGGRWQAAAAAALEDDEENAGGLEVAGSHRPVRKNSSVL